MEREPEITDHQLETIIAIARARAELVDRLQEALEHEDTAAALALAREVCGLPRSQERRPN